LDISGFLAGAIIISPEFQHLRQAGPREWSTYPAEPDAASLDVSFYTPDPTRFSVLTLRKRDTRQVWDVILNGEKIGVLPQDHNHLEHGLRLPADLLRASGNRLEIGTDPDGPDDIMVGHIALHEKEGFLRNEKEALFQKRGYQRAVSAFSTLLKLTAVNRVSTPPHSWPDRCADKNSLKKEIPVSICLFVEVEPLSLPRK